MTDSEDEMMLSLDDLIDRLVDQAIPPAELRLAFRRLEESPDGWRRCVMAFLEAQCWGDAMRSNEHSEVIGRPVRSPGPRLAWNPSPIDGRPLAPRAPRFRHLAGRSLAAAVVLGAFVLGWLGHGWQARKSQPMFQQSEVAALLSHPAAPPVEFERSAPPLQETLPRSLPRRTEDQVAPVREVARLRIGDGQAATAEVPILAGTGLDERWLLEQPPPISEHQRAIWERNGYQLEQRRRLVSVTLDDGRLAAVPVDQVRVRYVGSDPL
jgi:hypothetical protein